MADSSDSDETMAQTFIRLGEIKTLTQLYKQGVLSAASNAKYTYDKSLLDRVSLIQGDITKLQVDAIVNAANTGLLGGGGVDGAIHRAAGPGLLAECRTLNGCDTGDSKITKGYKLPSSHVIHTVGPIYSSSEVEENASLLRSCYQTSLELAVKHSLKHIAFPCISTGVYGYPIRDATTIALTTVREFLQGDDEKSKALDRVIFIVFLDKDRDTYQELLPEYFPSDEADSPSVGKEETSETSAPQKDPEEPEIGEEKKSP